MKGKKILYSDEEKKWIKKNVEGTYYHLLAERFCKTFNRNDVDRRLINDYCLRNGLDNGMPKHFPKGIVPKNKGTKGLYNVGGNKTSFKKGNIPINHKEVGSERIDRDGYILIKTKEPNVWRLKHRVLWEKHYGKIPKSQTIRFLDGNPQNLDLENLVLVSRREHSIINKNGYYYKNSELSKIGIKLAKIKVAINDRTKKRKDSIVNLKPIFSTITVTYKTVKGVKKQINTLDYVCPECKRLFTGKTDNCPNCKVELDWSEEK